MKLSRKRILLFTAILLFLIGLTFMAVYLKSVADYKRAVKETTFSNLDISNVPDGVYIGEYDVSGATNSSAVIKKAVENALTGEK